MRIGFVIWHLFEGASGVERVMTELVREMIRRGHKALVFTNVRPVERVGWALPLYSLPEDAEVMEVDLTTPERSRKARTLVAGSGVDVVLSMFSGQAHVLFPWLMAGSGIPLIAAEAYCPDVVAYRRWNAYEYYAAMAAADYIQVLLEPYRNLFPKALRRRVAVIGNVAPAAREVDWAARAARRERTLLGVGRFDEEHKCFSLLIRAWSLLAADFPEWKLRLVGDGPSRPVYEALVGSLGLAERVEMPGSVAADRVDDCYREADVFCMPSRREGFGLVLAEAAAWSLPLAGLKSCEAASFLIPPDAGVLAVDDTPAGLAAALRPLLEESAEGRRRLGVGARDAFSVFTPERVYGDWEALFARAAARRGRTRLERVLLEQWTPDVLRQGTLDLVTRDDPVKLVGGAGLSPASGLAKLISSHRVLEHEHDLLKRKYDVLVSEYRALAARADGVRGGGKKGRRK